MEGQEADGLDGLEDHQNEPLSIEEEPGEIRQSLAWALAASVGETFPGAGTGILALKTIHERAAWRLAVARGQRRFSGQSASGQLLSRKSRGTYLDLGYELWPALHFPFVLSSGLTVGDIVGTAVSTGSSRESYRLRTAAFGAEIVMESFFDRGFWLRWVLLSGRYVRVVSGDYGHMDGAAMSQVRRDHDGIQITGFANLSVGYSW